MPFAAHLLIALACWLVAASNARAQADDAGDLEAARSSALLAIQAGTAGPAELRALYLMLARTSARLGREDEARTAFHRLLAVDPTFRLPGGEPDAIRSPYMEARGFWSTHPVTLQVETAVERAESVMVLSVRDPLALAARVRVRARLTGHADYIEVVRPPQATLRVQLEGLRDAQAVDLALALLDEHGNRIFEHGSDAEPVHLSIAQAPSVESASPSQRSPAIAPQGEESSATPYYVAGALSLALGAGALAWGVLEHLERERLAQQWNEGRCFGPGTTRAQVCAHEHTRLEQSQRLAGALYAVGGAAALAGLLTLILAPRAHSGTDANARTTGCGAGPGLAGVACRGSF